MIGLDKKQIAIAGAILIVIIVIISYYLYTNLQNNEDEVIEIEETTIEEKETKTTEEEEQIIVHIAGEVKNPGIIKTKEGARIADIIEEAGGLKEEADITDINLAYPVEDGQKITIPKKGQETNEYITEESTSSGENNTKTTTTENKKININKATIEELQTLQGIRRSNGTKNNRLQKRKPEISNK